MTGTDRTKAGWSILIPVKHLHLAKSRLAVPDDLRAELALAMARDTVAACAGCPEVVEVVVVTDDARARAALSELGAHIVSDDPDAGLNAAVEHGLSSCHRGRALVLSSDLPALSANDLSAVVEAAAPVVDAGGAAVVSDIEGSGTTMLALAVSGAVRPAFGAASLEAHRAQGAVDLTSVAPPAARHDVDTVAGLLAAARLGLGASTSVLLEAAAEQSGEVTGL